MRSNTHVANEFYQGMQDIIFMSSHPEGVDNTLITLDKDANINNSVNYPNGSHYFQPQSTNYAAVAQQSTYP